MEFLVYAFAGVGVVASVWFLAEAFSRLVVRSGSGKASLEDRVFDLERRLP